MSEIVRPPTDSRKPWADWFQSIFLNLKGLLLPVRTDSNRGDPGNTGRVIFNTDDGQINIDNGTDWTLSDGSIT